MRPACSWVLDTAHTVVMSLRLPPDAASLLESHSMILFFPSEWFCLCKVHMRLTSSALHLIVATAEDGSAEHDSTKQALTSRPRSRLDAEGQLRLSFSACFSLTVHTAEPPQVALSSTQRKCKPPGLN